MIQATDGRRMSVPMTYKRLRLPMYILRYQKTDTAIKKGICDPVMCRMACSRSLNGRIVLVDFRQRIWCWPVGLLNDHPDAASSVYLKYLVNVRIID